MEKVLTIRNVTIGDRFIDTCNRKSKRVSTVVDFAETRSMTTGEVISVAVIAQHDFMGQTMTTNPAFATVVMNKVNTAPYPLV